MILKITEKDMGVLKEALEKALLHTGYNSECFSCSDIRRADAFNFDIERVFSILCDNSINIVKDMGEEFASQFKGYYNEADFANIQTPEKFEVLLFSDAIWRISKELFDLKYSDEEFLKIETKYFTKYWSVLTHGCIYYIAPNKEALLEFSKVSNSLRKVLHFVLPEIEDSEIKTIRAINFNENEIELDIQYIKDSKSYSLYLYETPERADVVISLDKKALRIYPIGTENQASLMFHDDNFINYYNKVIAENKRLEEAVKDMLDKYLKDINKDSSKYKNHDIETLEGKLYNYWVDFNELNHLEKELESINEETNDLYYCTVSENISHLSDYCIHLESEIEDILLKSIASEYFLNSYKKTYRQYNLMLDKDCILKENGYVDHIFERLNKKYKVNIA